jgi:hypothetical protein
LVRAILDEVFGISNFVAQITIEKTSSQTQEYLAPVTDYILWFGRNKETLKYRALRKATPVRLAEAGCTPHEIAAITGHASLKEIVRYTATADRKRLAASAMEKVKSRTSTG